MYAESKNILTHPHTHIALAVTSIELQETIVWSRRKTCVLLWYEVKPTSCVIR